MNEMNVYQALHWFAFQIICRVEAERVKRKNKEDSDIRRYHYSSINILQIDHIYFSFIFVFIDIVFSLL